MMASPSTAEYSFGYVANWAKDKVGLKRNLDSILIAAFEEEA
jgi:hypothetical protein